MGIRFGLLMTALFVLCACNKDAQFAAQKSLDSDPSQSLLSIDDQMDWLGSEIIDSDSSDSGHNDSADNSNDSGKNQNASQNEDNGKSKNRCIDSDDVDKVELARCGKDQQGHKVLVCHIPSGNAANAHEICISKNALKAHLKLHGNEQAKDYLGPCQ